jgi:hypothetical protein
MSESKAMAATRNEEPAAPPSAKLDASTPFPKEPHDNTIVSYEDESERYNSTLQSIWSSVMDEGQYRTSASYKKVCVLLLSWDKPDDDLQVEFEVNELANTLKELFDCDVNRAYLRSGKKTAQAQINKYVADFVFNCDGSDTLLIVYFAGHGFPGEYPGHLLLGGYGWFSDTTCREAKIPAGAHLPKSSENTSIASSGTTAKPLWPVLREMFWKYLIGKSRLLRFQYTRSDGSLAAMPVTLVSCGGIRGKIDQTPTHQECQVTGPPGCSNTSPLPPPAPRPEARVHTLLPPL